MEMMNGTLLKGLFFKYKINTFKIIAIFFALLFNCSCGNKDIVWTQYTSNEGGFMILMPKNYTKVDKMGETPFGKQLCHTVKWKPQTVSINKFLSFEVTYFDCPVKTVEDTVYQQIMLDSSIKLLLTEYTEANIETQSISLNGYPGRAFIYELKEGKVLAIVKICIANGREYDLTIITKRNYATTDEVDNFFNSFKVFR